MSNESNQPTPTPSSSLVFYHAPWSRAAGVRWLLEELGVPYELRVVDIRRAQGGGGEPNEDYRDVQPHKKVPAILDGDQIVHERAAITMYLADKYPEAGLAPALDDPMRPAYLTMLVYHDAVFDPCVSLHHVGVQLDRSAHAFGAYDDTIAHLKRTLKKQDFAAGSRFTAADTALASALGFTMNVFQAVPKEPEFLAYLARATDRPAYHRAAKLDEELMAQIMPDSRAAS